jgi:hypothetical protein
VIAIYCDEDVDVLVKPLLEAKGFRVRTTLDEKMLGASDRQQIDYAIDKGYLFLTHNRVHYEKIYAVLVSEAKDHSGIIIATRRNVYELARRISRVLSQFTKESVRNQILYV